MRTHLLLITWFVFCSGCANIPVPIAAVPAGNVPLAEVRATPQQFAGVSARWGGQIAAVRNLKEETQIEVVMRRLDSEGRPYAEDNSDGRFLAVVTGFVDPMLYEKGREITVRGMLAGTQEQLIGEYRYTYPVVRVEQVHLWSPRPPPLPLYDEPWWWDPWYPWYGPPRHW